MTYLYLIWNSYNAYKNIGNEELDDKKSEKSEEQKIEDEQTEDTNDVVIPIESDYPEEEIKEPMWVVFKNYFF